MSKIISVIVPIYNVKELLPKCIESICSQTYKDLEIILVNDGSTDNCGQICDEYALRDSRIKVIHKVNGGLSDARNAGIKIAKGEYVAFIDSDDYIVNDTYEILVNEAIKNNLDIVAANALLIKNDKCKNALMKKKTFPNEIMTGIEYMCQSIQQNSFHVCAWLNLYKRDLLIDNSLYFQKGILHEDEEWTPRVFLEAKRVKYMDFMCYMYVIREGSITKGKDRTKNGLDIINTCYKLEKLYDQKLNKQQKKILYGHLVNIFLGGIYLGRLDRPKYKKLVRKKFVIGKTQNLKDFLKALLFFVNMRVYSKVNELSKNKN
ncbi:glycosyltransferase [Clostridium cochlearium]|uniref:glycosyltransferase n=1 Tax=Clostridium cochlearium TaxID=1494 RepID=UPI0022E612AC|nr:glycosyltransferase [Clostridium cochlearium]